MLAAVRTYFIIIFAFIVSCSALSQEILPSKDTLLTKKIDKITLLTYLRVISDAKGNIRADQNFVGNFRIINWLKLEPGVRFGERPGHFDSYYHYKFELQTKTFYKMVRVIARISDDVINYPAPSYRKTNKLFAVEGKYSLSKLFQVIGGLGYVFSSQQNKEPDALPTNKGVQNNYPIFKIGIRYVFKNKSFFEATYGSYDVFNPYQLNSPFGQLTADIELTRFCALYSYFRYQYNNNVFTPNNYFLSAGIRFYLLEG